MTPSPTPPDGELREKVPVELEEQGDPGDGTKTLPPAVRRESVQLTCASSSTGVNSLEFHIARSRAACEEQFETQAVSWSLNVLAAAQASGLYTDVRHSTRCEEAEVFHTWPRNLPGLTAVSTTGTVTCTTIVYGNFVGSDN